MSSYITSLFNTNNLVIEDNHNIFGKKLLSTDVFDMYLINNYRKFVSVVKSWKGNRIISEKRVFEVMKSLVESNNFPHTTLYISEIIKNNDSKYYLWDGQHRFSAIEKCCMMNDDLSFLNNLFTCIVYKNDTKENMRKKFININKAVPVPDFYMDELVKDQRKLKLKELTENTVDRIKAEFPYNSSTSKRPLKPNFNSDNLSDDIYKYLDENKLEDIDENILWTNIMILNDYYKENLKITSYQTRDRANKTNCFLFCQNYLFLNDINFNDLVSEEPEDIENNIDV